jgi:uncharacterized protein YkwD
MRRLARSLPLVVGMGLLACGPALSRAVETEGGSVLEALVAAHNRERAAANLPPLAANPKLTAAAEAHARDMAEHDKMSHEGSDGSTPDQRIQRQGYHFKNSAENVAEGYETVDEVMKGWMNSPHHKANILGDFTEMGGARASSEDGKPYWCVTFGRPYPKVDPSRAASGMIEALNRAREKAGKPPLTANPKLDAAAQRHTQDMAAHGEFRHEDDDGLTPVQRVEKAGYAFQSFGEIAASGLADPEEVVKSWLDRPANRDYLLGDFRDVGVGVAASEKGIPFWCLLLAKPR